MRSSARNDRCRLFNSLAFNNEGTVPVPPICLLLDKCPKSHSALGQPTSRRPSRKMSWLRLAKDSRKTDYPCAPPSPPPCCRRARARHSSEIGRTRRIQAKSLTGKVSARRKNWKGATRKFVSVERLADPRVSLSSSSSSSLAPLPSPSHHPADRRPPASPETTVTRH
jgi:hypothetical protein